MKKRRSKLIVAFAFATLLSMSAFPAMADDSVSYLDEDGQTMSVEDYSLVKSDDGIWEDGWYVVDGSVTLSSRVTVSGSVDIILADGYTLDATAGGIDVSEGNSLTIYAQSTGDEMGILNATGSSGAAGIGGSKSTGVGTITINGGKITATGGSSAAGIGSGYLEASEGTIPEVDNGTIIINGGDITAKGKSNAGSAGIGGGRNAAAGIIEINGGTIEAEGKGDSYGSGAAGIGSGNAYDIYYGGASCEAEKGSITITGGTITSTGGSGAAGIGSGMYYPLCPDITINGGTITSKGRMGAAGIGSGVYAKETDYTITINDGDITASNSASYNSTSVFGGAGIGSGADNIGSCEVVINDGAITAKGNNYAPGIGIGSRNNDIGNCDGTITINGGDIYSYGESAIGNGYKQSGDLTLDILDGYFKMSRLAADVNYIGAGPDATGTVDVSITGGYYVTGDTDSDTVYEAEVADGYMVILNDEDTKTVWPYKVVQKTFLLSVTAPEFEDVVYGYEQPEAQSITISNEGNSTASITDVSVDSDSFIIDGSGDTVSAGNSIETWTIQPVAGLDAGEYSATITVSYNDTTATAEVSFIVTEQETDSLSIEAPEFEDVVYGYEQPEAQSIVISNTGNRDVTITSITIDNEDAFILSGSDYTVESGKSIDSWTIQPADGLPAGQYTATITISYNDTEITAELSFSVESDEEESSIVVTAGEGGSITLTDTSEEGYAVYEITPDDGYEIDVVLVDGKDVTDEVSNNQYVLTDVQGSHTISVTFKLVDTASESDESESDTETKTEDTETTDQATSSNASSSTSRRSSSSSGSSSGSSSNSSSVNSGSWVKDENGWKYVYKDGSYASGTSVTVDGGLYEQVSWKQISGKWWAFGSDGYLSTGWVLDWEKGLWYYVNENSGMETGWHYDTEDGYWYYLDTADGHMLTGWQQINGEWYYFNVYTESPTWEFDGNLSRWTYDENTSHRPLGSMYMDEATPDGYLVGTDGSYDNK